MVNLIFNTCSGQQLLQALKVFLAFIAQTFLQARCALAQLMAVRIFAVQKTQRIAVETALAILAQLVKIRLEESLQLFSVLRTAFGAAYGIDFQLQVLQAQALQPAE